MTHAQFFNSHMHWHLAAIRGYIALALSILSGSWRIMPGLDPIATAQLTNKAAAMSTEFMALETLEAVSSPAPAKPKAKPRPETAIERLILNCWQTPHHIKITPYVYLSDESKDGVLIRFYDAEGELIDVLTCSEPGEICLYGEAGREARRAA